MDLTISGLKLHVTVSQGKNDLFSLTLPVGNFLFQLLVLILYPYHLILHFILFLLFFLLLLILLFLFLPLWIFMFSSYSSSPINSTLSSAFFLASFSSSSSSYFYTLFYYFPSFSFYSPPFLFFISIFFLLPRFPFLFPSSQVSVFFLFFLSFLLLFPFRLHRLLLHYFLFFSWSTSAASPSSFEFHLPYHRNIPKVFFLWKADYS